MLRHCIFISTIILTAVAQAAPPDELRAQNYNYLPEPVFQEDFDGSQLNEDVWQIHDWEKAHDEPMEVFAHRDAVDVEGGKLVLRVFERNPGERNLKKKRVRVGHVQTRTWEKDRFEATYGYIEARIKFNTKPGAGAAFWLHSRRAQAGRPFGPGLPKNRMELDLNNPDEFLRQAGAEIDIVEALAEHQPKSNKLLPGDPPNTYLDYKRRWVINIHWNGYRDKKEKWQPGQLHQATGIALKLEPNQGRIVGDWHVFGLHWTPRHYGFFLDGKMMWQTTKGVSQQPEFIILSMGASDGKFAGLYPGKGYGGRGSDKNPTMKVDWVRWYQTAEQAAVTRAAGR